MICKKVSEATPITLGLPHPRTVEIVLSPRDGVKSHTFLICTLPPHVGQTNPHVHTVAETMYFMTGRGRAIVEDSREVALEPDTILFSPAGQKHHICNESDEPMKIACTFTPPLPEEYIDCLLKLSQEQS